MKKFLRGFITATVLILSILAICVYIQERETLKQVLLDVPIECQHSDYPTGCEGEHVVVIVGYTEDAFILNDPNTGS